MNKTLWVITKDGVPVGQLIDDTSKSESYLSKEGAIEQRDAWHPDCKVTPFVARES